MRIDFGIAMATAVFLDAGFPHDLPIPFDDGRSVIS
jgi:hypothetical protein